jgi:hypothetical protein
MRIDRLHLEGEAVVLLRLGLVEGRAGLGRFGHQFGHARGFGGAGIFKLSDLFGRGHGVRGLYRSNDG